MDNRFVTTIKRKVKYDDLSVIILASSQIPKMKNLGAKSLFMIDKHHTLLDIQYESIRHVFPESEVVLVAGHGSNEVIINKPKDLKVIENQLYETTGQLEELRLALNVVNNKKVLIVNGDMLFNANAIQQVKNHTSCILIDNKKVFSEDDIGCVVNNSVLESTGHGLPNKWCHIIYLENKELDLLKIVTNNKAKRNLHIHEAINFVVNNGGLIRSVLQNQGFVVRMDYKK